MVSARRNAITTRDARWVLLVTVASATGAALAGASPTGGVVVDAVLCAGWAALVTWLAASSPWWALFAGAALVGAASLGGPAWVTALGALGLVAAGVIGDARLNVPVVRALAGAATVQTSLRLEFDRFLVATVIAGVACLLIAVTGFRRRPRYVRRRVFWPAVGIAVGAAAATALFGIAAAGVRSPATDGYQAMLDGLDEVQQGDTAAAAASLRSASEDLGEAADAIGGALGQPARLVPVVAQNRNRTVEMLTDAERTAAEAADALAVVDLDRLRIVGGRVDLDAVEELAEPLRELDAAVDEIGTTIDAASSDPWLVAPLQDRLDDADTRLVQVRQQSEATALAAELLPDMLGARGDRRYFLAFVNPAESRGQSGLMGSWSEITTSDGRIAVTATGRTADLQEGLDDYGPLRLDMPDEFFTRYEVFGAGDGERPTSRDYWSNVTAPPDMPTVGDTLTQMYEASTGRALDGVFVLDPTALAAVIELTGPIEVEGVDERLTSENAVEFLELDQYEFAEADREGVLAAVSAAAVGQLLTETLPAPQELIRVIGPSVLEGHLSGYAAREDEQELFHLAFLGNELPDIDGDRVVDGLAVVSDNTSGNKIDSFLHRDVTYSADYASDTGRVDARLEIVLDNQAPDTGYSDYVIGNAIDRPAGFNRSMLTVFTQLDVSEVVIDGEPVDFEVEPEQGWNTVRTFVYLPSGGASTVELELGGWIEPGGYELAYRPQPLPVRDTVAIEVRDGDDLLVEVDEAPSRRSSITSDGVEAWR